MLKNNDDKKIAKINISNNQWQEILQVTREGVFRKLQASRQLLKNEGYEDFSAGLYIYALEEYGKYLLLKKCKSVSNNTKKSIIYRKEFADHDIKFKTVVDFLQNYNYESFQCCVLFDENLGSFSPKSFSLKSFRVGQLLADTKIRLSIFYSDFSYVDINKEIVTIDRPLSINKDLLIKAINHFEFIVKKYD